MILGQVYEILQSFCSQLRAPRLNVAKTQTSDSHPTSDIQVLDINRLRSKYIIFLTLDRNGWSFLDLLARAQIKINLSLLLVKTLV